MNNTNDKIKYGAVHLSVTKLESSIEFWTDIIGLNLRKKGKTAELGTEDQTLLVLYEDAESKFLNGYSGLYHLAVHIPTESEFAQVLRRFIDKRYPISPVDHTMSKAIYLMDPDGITVEITLETPERFERYNYDPNSFEVIDNNGNVHGATEPLNMGLVLSKLENYKINKKVPNSTYIGHVHLYVDNLRTNYAFYQTLGFEDNLIGERLGFADLSAGGEFKHRIAMNTWNSAGRKQSPVNSAGMKYFGIEYLDKEFNKQVLENLDNKKQSEDGWILEDPAENRVKVLVYSV